MATIPATRPALRTSDLIAADLAAATGRSGWRGLLAAAIYEPGFATVLKHRIAQYLQHHGWPRLGKLLWRWNTAASGCHLHLDAGLGPGLVLQHPTAIVIGSGVSVGAGVTLYQGVTLGRRHGEQYPVVDDGATLHANAIVLGPVRIGRRAVVGAGAVVLHDVPDDRVAVGNPARLLPLRAAAGDAGAHGARGAAPHPAAAPATAEPAA